MIEEKKLPLPGSSWETVKKIIRAFHAAHDQEDPTVESIAHLAGVPRPVVSTNNGFLRSLGIIQPEQWKLTDIGSRYALGLTMGNVVMSSQALREAIRGNETLTKLVGILNARGAMDLDTFKAEAMLLFGLNAKSRQVPFIKTLIDMLNEARAIRITDDTARAGDNSIPAVKDADEQRHSPEKEEVKLEGSLPILLAPGRLAWIRLPEDWDKKELPKLLKLLEISLGDKME